jgi:hypothetical protein
MARPLYKHLFTAHPKTDSFCVKTGGQDKNMESLGAHEIPLLPAIKDWLCTLAYPLSCSAFKTPVEILRNLLRLNAE